MNRQRAKELLPIIQAFAEGKTVQVGHGKDPLWVDADDPSWAGGFNYRIKPEPVRVYVATWKSDGKILSDSCFEHEKIDAEKWLRTLPCEHERNTIRIDVIEREAP